MRFTLNKFFSSRQWKIIITILFVGIVFAAVLYALVYMANGPLNVSKKEDTPQNYGNGLTLQDTESIRSRNNESTMKVAILNKDGEVEAESGDYADLNTASAVTNDELEKLRDEQIESILAENGLSMYDFVNYKDKIADSVLAQIQKVLDEYDKKMDVVIANQGVNGKDGKDGKQGIAGKDGKDGKDGLNGKDGKDGVKGKDGVDGKDGINGTDGIDGKNVFIKYAEDANGTGMTDTPNDKTKYMGTYSGSTEPTSATSYSWTQYRDLIVSFDESTNTLLIH